MHRAVGVAVLVLLVTAGCGSAPAGPPDPFPPRPFPIDVANLDPCTTLTRAQIEALGPAPSISSGQPNLGGRPSRACAWNPSGPGYAYSVQTISFDAGESVGAPNTSVETVLGFGAVRAPDPEYATPICDFIIDAADGASLRVTVQSFGREADGSKTPIPLVCDQARTLAVDVLTNLRATAAR